MTDTNLLTYLSGGIPVAAFCLVALWAVWRRYVVTADARIEDGKTLVKATIALDAVASSNVALVAVVTALNAKVDGFSAQLAEQREECEALRKEIHDRTIAEAAAENQRKAGPQSVRGR